MRMLPVQQQHRKRKLLTRNLPKHPQLSLLLHRTECFPVIIVVIYRTRDFR